MESETFRCKLCGRQLPISKMSPPFWDPQVEKPVCLQCYESRPELELARKVKEAFEESLRRIKERRRGR